MASGTNVYTRCGIQQFQGLFENVMVLEFDLNTGSIAANSSAEDTVAVPGLNYHCIILGYSFDVEPQHDCVHEVHAVPDTLHIVTHNTSAGAVDPPLTHWKVVIARLRIP